MTWRQNLIGYIDPNIDGDAYHFGTHSGASLIEVANLLNENIRHIGFDSFEGLPADPSEAPWYPEWSPGLMNVQTHFNVQSKSEAIDLVTQNVQANCNAEFVLIPGFFEDSLNDDLLTALNLKPATYIDVDCDLYSSTITCLDYMFKNKLVLPGTVIGFDDWKETPGWQDNLSGESKAWLEISQKYLIDFEFLYQDQSAVPLSYYVIRIISIGEQK